MPKDKSLISWGSKGMNKRKAKNRNSKYKKIPRIIEWFISEKSNTKSYFTIGKQMSAKKNLYLPTFPLLGYIIQRSNRQAQTFSRDTGAPGRPSDPKYN